VITLRRATPEDVPFLSTLFEDEDVEPFLGGQRAVGDAALLADVQRSQTASESFGRMVIEIDGVPAGALGYRELSELHRIAQLEALAIHPDFRRRGIADEAARLAQRYLLLELGFHRLELACYGFNDAAIRHSERAGFVREGVKRRAYLRHGEWQDAVLFSLLREDLEIPDRSENDADPVSG
jgi:RimJ/RimL family protein N-acetyltransferase